MAADGSRDWRQAARRVGRVAEAVAPVAAAAGRRVLGEGTPAPAPDAAVDGWLRRDAQAVAMPGLAPRLVGLARAGALRRGRDRPVGDLLVAPLCAADAPDDVLAAVVSRPRVLHHDGRSSLPVLLLESAVDAPATDTDVVTPDKPLAVVDPSGAPVWERREEGEVAVVLGAAGRLGEVRPHSRRTRALVAAGGRVLHDDVAVLQLRVLHGWAQGGLRSAAPTAAGVRLPDDVTAGDGETVLAAVLLML